MTTHLAVIPARGGSKGLRRKNVAPLGGLPMITYTIRAAQRSGEFEAIVVVSDDDETLQIAETEGAHAMREPDEMAGDTVSSTVPVLWVEEQLNSPFDYVWNLQPSSPLRGPTDISRAVRTLNERPEADFLASVTPTDPHDFHWALREKDGFAELWFPEFLMDRSLLPPALSPNGAIKAGRPGRLRAEGSVFAPRLVTIEMPAMRGMHVRSQWDLELAGFIIERHPEEFEWASR